MIHIVCVNAGNYCGAGRRYVETYCYAFAGSNFLEDEPQQLYWRTDIVQMTRYYMIEAAHSGIHCSHHGCVVSFLSKAPSKRSGRGRLVIRPPAFMR